MDLETARKEARAARMKVDQGVDVAAERRKTKIEIARAKTVRDLADDYLERVAPTLAPQTAGEIRRYITKDILPRIGHIAPSKSYP
jgi:hypothetical protein